MPSRTGTCAGHYFKLGTGGSKSCEELSIRVDFRSARFIARNWTIAVRGNHVWDRLSGPAHRLDLSFSARGDAPARSLPHGIIGQSFASDRSRHGKVDLYPAEGTFETKAMAEGAIEGSAAQYEVASRYQTSFEFSRFDAPEVQPQLDLVLAPADAAAASDQDLQDLDL